MTGDSEVVASARQTGQQSASVELSEGERHSFARYVKPVFNGVVFWINPIFGRQESARIAQLLEHGGGRAGTTRRHGRAPGDGDEDDSAQKLNGVLVREIPQMASHISRFYWAQGGNSNRNSNGNGDGDSDGVQRVTHVISPDTHFGEYQACVKAGVHVVTRLWVERCLLSGVQYVERYFSAHADDIFSGMVVTVTQMPRADRDTLLASVMALGGQWREKMRADVTHLVLMKDLGPKYEFAQQHPELGIRAILPHWFKETLNLLRCVPHEPYLFPNPPMLEGRTSRDVGAGRAQLALPLSGNDNGGAYELPKPTAAFMRGYTVAVDTQLLYSLSEAALARLGQRLAEAGATVARPLAAAAAAEASSGGRRLLMAESAVADWASVDILVCQHRAGYDYCKASRLGKMVGTLVWLYEAFLSERLSAPTQRLLHYPAPAVVVGGMDRMVVAVSHYTGAARQYLIRLITALGARYTAKLTRENTHLVTAQPEGRKYAAAVQWNVHVVNHLWVERCYQRWKLLTVTHPNFSYFPDLPVLNSMVGDTEVSVDRLKAWVEAPQGASMAEWSDMDVLSDSALAADPPLPASGKNGNGACSSSGEEEMKSVGDSSSSSSSSSSAGEEKEREGAAAAAADDDEPPLVLGQRRRHTSRAAAMAASKSLGVIMQAVNTFEADMRRERLYKYRSKSHGGRRALALALEEEEEEGGEEEEKEKEKEKESRVLVRAGAKRARTDKDGNSVRIMFTSVRATEQQQRQIASMGGEIVSDAAHATHLVCVEIKRTLKMLMALASGRVSIVSLAWLEHSLAQRRWVSMRAGDADPLAAKCRVVDAAAERRWSFRLEESVQRASRRRLLEGVTVFVTPQSEPPLTVLRPLIEIAGGEAVDSLPEARLRALVSASVAASGTSGGGSSGSPPLLVVSCREDSHMWPMFRPAGNQRMPIHATEMLLTGLLRQQIQRSDDEYALNP